MSFPHKVQGTVSRIFWLLLDISQNAKQNIDFKGESNADNLEVACSLVKLSHFLLYSRERKKEKRNRKQAIYSTVHSPLKIYLPLDKHASL